jgi:hypothetical protein
MMAKKRGPKTLASKGLKPKLQITISVPAELHDKIIDLINDENNKSKVITQLLEIALAVGKNQIRE